MADSDLKMRPARAADIPEVLRLLADDALGKGRETVSDQIDPAYLAAFKAISEDPNHQLVVAELAGRVVGTMQLSFLPGLSHRGSWRGQIESVRIDSALRGQGLGGMMFDWAIAQCRSRGCRMVQLTTNTSRSEAHRFYDRLGFEASHVGYKLTL